MASVVVQSYMEVTTKCERCADEFGGESCKCATCNDVLCFFCYYDVEEGANDLGLCSRCYVCANRYE